MSIPARYFPKLDNKDKILKAVVDVFGSEAAYVDNAANRALVTAAYVKRGGKVKP